MSSGSPGRVKHLVPAWWQALQPGSLIVHRIVVIVLSNDLFLWFWQDKEGKRTAVRTREIPILQSGPGETHSHSHGLCVCVHTRSHMPEQILLMFQIQVSEYQDLAKNLLKSVLFTGTTTQTYLVSDFRYIKKKNIHIYSASEFK